MVSSVFLHSSKDRTENESDLANEEMTRAGRKIHFPQFDYIPQSLIYLCTTYIYLLVHSDLKPQILRILLIISVYVTSLSNHGIRIFRIFNIRTTCLIEKESIGSTCGTRIILRYKYLNWKHQLINLFDNVKTVRHIHYEKKLNSNRMNLLV